MIVSASVAATYTDPRTWRAILVMAIALVAILVGALVFALQAVLQPLELDLVAVGVVQIERVADPVV